jgi:hypothetical protein
MAAFLAAARPTEPMQHLTELLTSIVPIVAIVSIGVLCRHLRIWDKSATRSLNSYAYYIALPALFFQSIYATRLATLLSPTHVRLLVGVVIAHAVVFVLALVLMAVFRPPKTTRAIVPMLLVFGNFAYLGVPFALNTFGVESTSYVTLLSIVMAVTTLFLSLLALNWQLGDSSGRNAFRRFAELPFLWAVVAGVIVSWWNIPIPGFIAKTVDIVAGSAGPTALLALGAFDYDLRLKDVNILTAFLLGAGKVLLTGAATFIVLKLLGITGLPLVVGTTMGAVSIAVTAFVLTDQYKANRALTDAAIAVSSVSAFVALTVISFLWFSTGVFK